jgi:hypothetical protein
MVNNVHVPRETGSPGDLPSTMPLDTARSLWSPGLELPFSKGFGKSVPHRDLEDGRWWHREGPNHKRPRLARAKCPKTQWGSERWTSFLSEWIWWWLQWNRSNAALCPGSNYTSIFHRALNCMLPPCERLVRPWCKRHSEQLHGTRTWTQVHLPHKTLGLSAPERCHCLDPPPPVWAWLVLVRRHEGCLGGRGLGFASCSALLLTSLRSLNRSQEWWSPPVIPAPGRLRKENLKFDANWAIPWDLVSEKKKKKKSELGRTLCLFTC